MCGETAGTWTAKRVSASGFFGTFSEILGDLRKSSGHPQKILELRAPQDKILTPLTQKKLAGIRNYLILT